jgi:hypothetical protein
MPVPPSTRQRLDDHLGQAEFALKVASNFACLGDTPAHAAVRAALAQVGTARAWVQAHLAVEAPAAKPPDLAYQTVASRRRIVHRAMARLVP